MWRILERGLFHGPCLLITIAWLIGCGGSESTRLPTLEELSKPDFSTFEEPVAAQLAAAYEEWQRVMKEPDAAPEILAIAAGELGRRLQVYGQLEAAEAVYRNATKLDPRTHDWAYLRGVMLQEEGEMGAAIEPLELAATIEPEDLPTRLRLARSYLAAGRPEEAKLELQAALSVAPRSALAFFLAGQLELEHGDAHAAVLAFERALEIQPEADNVHGSIAAAFEKLGDFERAHDHRQRIGDRRLHAADPLRAKLAELDLSSRAILEKAHRARLAGDAKSALELYQQAVESAPRSVAAHSALGAIMAELGQLDAAIKEMRDAQRLDSQNPRVLINLAEVHRLRGEHEAAAAAHRRVLTLAPDDLKARLGLARALAAQGKSAEAIDIYCALIADQPSHVQAAAELQALLEPESLASRHA